MNQLGHLATRRALTARIPVMRIGAIKILHICQSKGKGTASFIFVHQHGMGNPAAVRHGSERAGYIRITYYL
jgi:hypothetical protein